MARQHLRTRTAGPEQPAVHDDVRLLYTYVRIQSALATRSARRYSMGILKLLHNNHRGRTYMEIRDIGIYTTDNRRTCDCISGRIYPWGCAGCCIRNAAAQRQSSADVILFRIRDGRNGSRISMDCHTHRKSPPLDVGNRGMSGSRIACCRREPAEHLQHLRIFKRDKTFRIRPNGRRKQSVG